MSPLSDRVYRRGEKSRDCGSKRLAVGKRGGMNYKSLTTTFSGYQQRSALTVTELQDAFLNTFPRDDIEQREPLWNANQRIVVAAMSMTKGV